MNQLASPTPFFLGSFSSFFSIQNEIAFYDEEIEKVRQTIAAVAHGGDPAASLPTGAGAVVGAQNLCTRFVPLSDAGGFIAPVRSTNKYLCSLGDNYFIRGDRDSALRVLQRRHAFLVGRRAKVAQSLLQAARAIADSAHLLGADAASELEQVLVACRSVFLPAGESLDSDLGRRISDALLSHGGNGHGVHEDADSSDISAGPGLRASSDSESSDEDAELAFTSGPSDPTTSSVLTRLLEAEQSFTGDPSSLEAEEHAKLVVRRVKGSGGRRGKAGSAAIPPAAVPKSSQPPRKRQAMKPPSSTSSTLTSTSTSTQRLPSPATSASPTPSPAPKARPPSRFKQERASKRVPTQAESEMMSRIRRL